MIGNKSYSCVVKVVGDRIYVKQSGARFWFTEKDLVRIIAKLQADLYEWQLMLAKLRQVRAQQETW